MMKAQPKFRRGLFFFVVFGFSGILNAFEVEHVDFPMPEQIPAKFKIEKKSVISVAPDGTYMVDGKPRYLIQVKLAGQAPRQDMANHTPGYPDSMKWLYETGLDFNIMQRVGFDFVGCGKIEWKNPYFKQMRRDSFWRDEYLLKDGYYLHLSASSGASHINYGGLKKDFPVEALNQSRNASGNHYFPWSALHPVGRNFYMECFRVMAETAMKKKAKVLRYELFNEPAYNDRSVSNRRYFALWLKNKYKTPEAMNRFWGSSYKSFADASQYNADSDFAGLYIDWCKFMEEAFTNLCRDGANLIRSIDPAARTCVQQMGGMNYRHTPMNHVNIFEINKYMGAISTPTAGGCSPAKGESAAEHVIDTASSANAGEGRAIVAYHLAMADGKPVHDDETYFGRGGKLFFHMSAMRGIGSSAVFEWGKRGWECKTEKICREVAAKWPWFLLNPFSVDPKKFLEIMTFRREMDSVADLYLRRDRNVPARIAMMTSTPTERFSGFTGNMSANHINNAVCALMFGHWQFEFMLEEQLAENRQDRFRVLIAPGMRNCYEKTPEYLDKWVRKGGIFIALLDTLNDGEYGKPLEKQLFDLKTAKPDDTPVVF